MDVSLVDDCVCVDDLWLHHVRLPLVLLVVRVAVMPRQTPGALNAGANPRFPEQPENACIKLHVWLLSPRSDAAPHLHTAHCLKDLNGCNLIVYPLHTSKPKLQFLVYAHTTC